MSAEPLRFEESRGCDHRGRDTWIRARRAPCAALEVVKPKTEDSKRTVSVPADLMDMLQKQAEGKSRDEFVFGADKPMRHHNFYTGVFRQAVQRLVDSGRWPKEISSLRFHDLRHTAASLLIRQGEHPKAIADRSGTRTSA